MRILTRLLGKAGLLLSVAAIGGEPATASACSCLAQPIYQSEPKAGASDVELNRAVLLVGNHVADGIVFEEMGGQPVAFDATHGPTPGCPGMASELIPRAPLRPNTRYQVRVRAAYPTPGDNQIEFTTGTAMLSDPPLRTPRASASMLSGVSSSGCGGGQYVTCVSVEDYDDVEITAKRGGATVLRWMAHDVNGTFAFEQAPDCVEVRRRSPTGKRSEPVSICGEALKTRPYQDGDRDENRGLLCEHGVIGAKMAAPSTQMRAEAQASAGSSASTERPPTPPAAAARRDAGCAVAHPHGESESCALAAGFFALLMAAGTRRLRRR